MRIASYYDNEISGNRNYGAPLYVGELLKQAKGIEYVHLIPNETARAHGTFDFHLWIDWGEDNWPQYRVNPFLCPKPNAYWVSDCHWNPSALEYRLRKSEEFDTVLVNHKQFVETFKKHLGHERVYWLPFAAEPRAYPYEAAVPKYDISFIGHLNTLERVTFLDKMFRAYENSFWATRFFEQAAEIYQQTKVNLNDCVAKDLNMRIFEITCAGGFLLTPHAVGLEECFDIGKEVVTYDSAEEAIEKTRYYLDHESERLAIAEAGRIRCRHDHTYTKRVEEILNHCLTKEEIHA